MEKDLDKLWHGVLESIKVSVSPAIFTTWFAQTHLSTLIKDEKKYVAEVGCSSPFAKNTIETRYFGTTKDALSNALGTACDLLLIVKEDPKKEKPGETPVPLFENGQDLGKLRQTKNLSGLRIPFTFTNFAVSSSNQMAWAAAEATSKDPGKAYNPLFIWGGVGVGKTHLMQAIGHYILDAKNETSVYCCTGEQFTNDIVEGIRNKTTPAVRAKYRKLNVLLVDDVQFIAGKDAIQEEFFHTFNSLVTSGGQVVLTSDRPPSEISKLEERLRSRFEAGLIVDISPPDFELRCAIIQIKARERGLDIPMDMVQLIAGNLESARKIEGFLVKISSEAKLKNSDVTPSLIESLIEKGVGKNEQTVIKAGPNEVINAVAKYFAIGKRSLLGSSRTRPLAHPRQILMYILRTELGYPLQEVGRIVGRDHTTVMHAVDKVTHLTSKDVDIRADIRGIKNMF